MLKKEYKIEEKSFDKVNLVLKSHVVEINYDDEIIKLSDGDVAFENDLSEDDQKIFGIDSYISVKRTKLLEQLDNLSMLRSGNFCIISDPANDSHYVLKQDLVKSIKVQTDTSKVEDVWVYKPKYTLKHKWIWEK